MSISGSGRRWIVGWRVNVVVPRLDRTPRHRRIGRSGVSAIHRVDDWATYDRLMVKGGWKTIGFLGATAVVLGWETFASFDDDPGTCPWTDLIVTYVPTEVTVALIGALVAWLPIHFGVRYWRRARRRRDER